MHAASAQSHASYGRCGLGSEGTDRLVALVRAEAAAARAAGAEPPLYGAKITGGGSGGARRGGRRGLGKCLGYARGFREMRMHQVCLWQGSEATTAAAGRPDKRSGSHTAWGQPDPGSPFRYARAAGPCGPGGQGGAHAFSQKLKARP